MPEDSSTETKTNENPKALGKDSVSAKVKSAADIFKSVGVFLAFGWALISFVAILFWEARGEPWLTERIKIQLEEAEHEDWFRQQVLLALSDNRISLARQIEQEHTGKPIVESFQRKIRSEDMEVLFSEKKFQDVFLREILLSISGRDNLSVDKVLASYKSRDFLEVWSNPPAISALAGTVTEQVDALYTFELFFTREARWENGRPVRDADGLQEFETRRQVADRFYATSDQRISIEVDPNLTGRFREAFNSGASQLYLEIGSTYRVPIPRNGLVEEVTCVIREQLRGKPSGFVSIRAITSSGDIPEGGYELDVIITARKGGYKCS